MNVLAKIKKLRRKGVLLWNCDLGHNTGATQHTFPPMPPTIHLSCDSYRYAAISIYFLTVTEYRYLCAENFWKSQRGALYVICAGVWPGLGVLLYLGKPTLIRYMNIRKGVTR